MTDDLPHHAESVSSIAMDLICSVDDEYPSGYELQGAVVLIAAKPNDGSDGGTFFMRTLDSQTTWLTAGMLKAAEMNVEARWQGWEDDEGE